MKACQLSPLHRILLLSRLSPTEHRDDVRRLAAIAKERVVREGEVLQRAGDPLRVVWITVDAVIQRTRNGQTFPPFEPPSPVGLIEALAGGGAGSQFEVLEGGIVLEIPALEVVELIMTGRRSLLRIMRSLGRAVVATVGLLPQPTTAVVELGDTDTLTLLDRLLLLSVGGLLSRVPLDTVAPLARMMTQRVFKEGDTLWRAGDVTGSGSLIARGRIRCTQPDGQTADGLPTTTLGFLDQLVLGEMSFTAVAATDVVVLELPVQVTVEAMETHDNFAYAIIQSMALAVVEMPVLIQARDVLEAEGV